MLGIERVQEVVIGLNEYERRSQVWARLFSPVAPDEVGCWSLGAGPKLRLVAAQQTGIRALVLKVASLERARAFLHERQMLVEAVEDTVIALLHPRGLEVRLVK